MVTSITKYDPDYHSNIPRNFRSYWNGTLLSDKMEPKPNHDIPEHWTDERIFNLWKECYTYDDNVYEHMASYILDSQFEY